MTKCFQNFLHKMNNHYVTYVLIGPHINDHLSINCNTFDIIIILLDFITIHKQ